MCGLGGSAYLDSQEIAALSPEAVTADPNRVAAAHASFAALSSLGDRPVARSQVILSRRVYFALQLAPPSLCPTAAAAIARVHGERSQPIYLTEWVGVAYALNSCYRHVCARARRTGCRCWVHCLALPTPSSQRVTTAGAFSGRRPPAWPCQSCCWTAPPHHSRLTRSIQRGSQWMATADLASAPRPAESTYFDCTRNLQHYKNLIIPVHFIHHCRHATSPETASESKWAHRSPHHSGSFLQSHDGGCHSR